MPLPNDQQERYIEIWSKAVDTQMHFNEMSVKSRQLGLAFVAAALGVAVVLISRGTEYSIDIPEMMPWVSVHVAVIIVLAALIALRAVRTLDVNVYHKMLRGAVTFGEDFEENYMKQIFSLDKGMTQAISHFSRFEDAKADTDLATGKKIYKGSNQRTALDKIEEFYRKASWFLIAAAASIFILTNLDNWIGGRSETSRQTQQSAERPQARTSPEPATQLPMPSVSPTPPTATATQQNVVPNEPKAAGEQTPQEGK